MMKYTSITGIHKNISRICLGCMGFGEALQGMHSWTLPYEESEKVIAYALKNGMNFFDTAMAYQGGSSERFLGRAIKTLANREDVVIATKFMPRTPQQCAQGISVSAHIEQCLAGSLQRLELEYVDLYILHKWDDTAPIEETLACLYALIQTGKIKAIGVSNCYAWQIAKANEIAKAHGWEPFVSVQGHYNLIFREEEREMKPYCDAHGIAMTPYSALASGRLAKHPKEMSKRLIEDTYAKGKYDASAAMDAVIIQRVEELAQNKGVSMSVIALSWLLGKVHAPIIGASKPSHLDAALQALDCPLTQGEVEYLEACYQPHPLVGIMVK